MPGYLTAFRFPPVVWLLVEKPKARVVSVRGWLGGYFGYRWLPSASAGYGWPEIKTDIFDIYNTDEDDSGCGWLGVWLGVGSTNWIYKI